MRTNTEILKTIEHNVAHQPLVDVDIIVEGDQAVALELAQRLENAVAEVLDEFDPAEVR